MDEANQPTVEFFVVEAQRTSRGTEHQIIAGPFPERAPARGALEQLLPTHPGAHISRIEWED